FEAPVPVRLQTALELLTEPLTPGLDGVLDKNVLLATFTAEEVALAGAFIRELLAVGLLNDVLRWERVVELVEERIAAVLGELARRRQARKAKGVSGDAD